MFALVYDKGSTGVYFSPRPNMWKSQRCPGSPWVLKLPTGGGVAGEIDCSALEVFSVRSAVYFINTITEVCFFFHLPNWQSQPRQSQSAIKKNNSYFFFSPCSQNRWTSASNGVGSITTSAAAASLINTGIIQNTLPVLQERRSRGGWRGGATKWA